MMRNIPTFLMLPLILVLSISLPDSALAQDHDAEVKKDLKTVLALKGKSCDEITSIKTQGENDYLVTCKNGKRYRIRIDANDRVLVEDRK